MSRLGSRLTSSTRLPDGHQQYDPADIHVLVVDDEPGIRWFLEGTLRRAGYATTSAGNSDDALRAAATLGAFDLVVTDYSMPGMNGCELVQRLRHKQPDLKVLYLTGFSDALFTDKGTLWAEEAFVEKPCTAQAIREAVSLLICGRIVAHGPLN